MRSAVALAAFLVVACGCGATTPARPTCTEIFERCHPLDIGPGEIHECHEFAELETSTEAQCAAMRTACFAACTVGPDVGVMVDSGAPRDSAAAIDSGRDDSGR